MSSWNLSVAEDGIATLTLDCPDTKLNIMSKTVFQDLNDTLDEAAKRADIQGMLLVSGKPDNFVAGANIEEFLEMKSAQDAAQASSQAQSVFQKIEDLRFPTVAAVNGTCLGGGLEFILSCKARVCSDDPKTTFAAPEVQLGILPGAGGTQRLPRVVGLANALDLNMTGRTIRAKQALKMGLVTMLAPKENLIDAGRMEIARLKAGKPPARKKKLAAKIQSMLLEQNPFGRKIMYNKAEAMLKKKGGHYPAPKQALEAMRIGIEEGNAAGFKAESRLFGELAMTPISRELIRLFFAVTDLKKDSGVGKKKVEKMAVNKLITIGSGFMGSGIAQVAAEKCTPVRMFDSSKEMLGRALANCRKDWETKTKRGRMTPQKFQQTMDRLSATTDFTGFNSADLVIEAVFEDLSIKHDVMKRAEEHLPEHAIFASNTSSIPISDIAKASKRPERVLGMHFFSPVPKMPLLEIIVTDKTDPAVTATAVAYGKKMGKTVIVVSDKCGFYTSRVLAFFMNEAALMLQEGADIAEIDKAMLRFGFPVGPFTLMDEVGLDIGKHVTRVMEDGYGERLKVATAIAKVVDAGRLGKKNKSGFYDYKSKKKVVDETVYDLLPGGRDRRHTPESEIQQRLWLTFAAECVRCLDEKVLQNPRDGDVGAIMGLGFPPFLGGPFRYMDALGLDQVIKGMEGLAKKHGDRLAPPESLLKLAKGKKSFYGGKDRWA